ncbi:MAG: 3-dehydroquinate synthase [Alphaproteobacteria bacterium]
MEHSGRESGSAPVSGQPETVRVAAGGGAYNVVIGGGLIGSAGERIRPLLKRPKTVVVTDRMVQSVHGAALSASLGAAEIDHETVVLPEGEATKSLTQLEALCDALLGHGIERSDTIIAFGGGVIGDLTGFAAAVLHRGIGFIQIPTTLLAQVDSSVGGKTGVNLAAGKNLVGAFHQPRLVLADTDSLATLSDREYAAGYAEVVKYGALGDGVFFDWLEANGASLTAREPGVLIRAVRRCVEMKAEIVEADEKEAGRRMLLNLGHTFGHAIEACAGYDGRVLHGEAVSVGMVLACELSVRLGHAPASVPERLRAHVHRAGLPTDVAALPVALSTDALMAAMAKDKKARDGKLTLILVRSIGDAFATGEVPVEQVLAVWQAALARTRA